MKKRKIKVLLCLLLCMQTLVLSACSAREEILFMDSEAGMVEGNSTEEIMDERIKEMSGTKEVAGTKEVSETKALSGTKEENGGNEKSNESLPLGENETTRIDTSDGGSKLIVHVCGAVESPGVYELAEGNRVMDAVLAAGGFLKEADEEYVNLATFLKDGDKVRIPTKNEVAEMSEGAETQNDNGVTNEKNPINTQTAGSDKVNINTADEQELCTLPGIGKTRAESILVYRREHGAFSNIEDIMQVSGIKENSFQKIKDRITVE